MKNKTLLLSLLIFTSSTFATTSYLGKSDEQSVIISISPVGTKFNSGDKVKFNGTVKVDATTSFWDTFWSWFGGNKNKGLYEDFKKNGVEIMASFPSSAIEVTDKLSIQSTSQNEFKFSFESDSINAEDLNQFSLKIYNNQQDQRKLRQLSSIQGKLERRLAALNDLKIYYKKNKALAAVITVVEKEIIFISSLRDKVEDRINSDDNLIADNTYPIQIGNQVSNLAHVSTSINGFRFAITANPGNSFDKTQVAVTAKVSRVDSDPLDDYFKSKGKYEYLAELYKDNALVGSDKLLTTSSSVSLSQTFNNLTYSQDNKLELRFQRVDKNKKKTKIGSFFYDLNVLRDQIAPTWLAESTPAGQIYVKNFPALNLKASDSFGRINLNSLAVSVEGQTVTGSPVNQNIKSDLTATLSPIGDELTVTGPSNITDEGSYTLKASITDTSGNVGTYSSQVTIDHTPPAIIFAHSESYESPTEEFNLVVNINDVSPVDSSIFLNDIQISYAHLTSYQVPMTLRPGTNSIKVVATDKAGNSSEKISTIIYDITPPVLTFTTPTEAQDFYSNLSSLNIPVSISSNEALSVAEINGESATLSEDKKSISHTIAFNSSGTKEISVKAKDLAGNESIITRLVSIHFDNQAPIISLSYSGQTLTKESSVPVAVNIQDESPAWSKVIINDQIMYETRNKNFNVSFELPLEGINSLKIISIDEANNTSESSVLSVTKDSTPPVLAALTPANGSLIQRVSFPVSGTSNEPLSSVSVDGLQLTLSGDKKSFAGTYVSNGQGLHQFTWLAVDIAGNESTQTTSVDIQSRLLIPELVSIIPDQDGRHLYIVGSIGATRPSSEVKASEGLFSFNSDSTTSKTDGSFSLRLENFSSVTLTATESGESESTTISYNNTTHLSGVVKDTNGNPLPGATVSLLGFSEFVVTDGSGVFSFQVPSTGDQTLSINGSTIPQSVTGPAKAFATTNVFVNIGLGQSNVLPRPIYLAPLLLDGSQTTIAANTSAVVESAAAPGVALEIPANAVLFPTGGQQGDINIATIPSEMATVAVPSVAVPNTVLALEPSGLSFTERVPLTLPNDNELPAGTEMLILSMNSKTGKWEVDGSAVVTTDGGSVKTKDGEGISHFSLVYAIPLRPFITEVSDPNVAGIDISKNAMTTKVNLPSFKSLGQSITPSLTYNSSWAHPTAFVSNIFDFGAAQSVVTYKSSSSGSSVQRVNFQKCFIVCWSDYKNFYHNWMSSEDITVENRVIPESIKTQFFVSGVSSQNVEFTTNTDETEERLAGTDFKGSLASTINEKTGLPANSMITYAVPLKNPESDTFLESGIYPTLARYQIRLKNMTITTGTYTNQYRIDGKIIPEYSSTYDVSTTDTVFQDIAPQDLVSTIIVQNKVNSPYGRGWNLGASQKILNKNGNRVVIEEAGGGVSTYGLQNSISTLFNANNTQYNLSSAADLSQWPKAIVTYTDTSKDNYLVEFDLSSPASQGANLGKVQVLTGRIANQGYHVCPAGYNSGTFQPSYHDFKEVLKPGGILRTNDGSVLVNSTLTHSLMRNLNGTSTKLGGRSQDVAPSLLYGAVFNSPQAQIDQFCMNNYGANCAAPIVQTSRNCTAVRDFCPSGNICTRPASFINSDGNMPFGDYGGDGMTGALINYPSVVAFNAPMAMTLTPIGTVLMADTGNNVIREMNLTTGTINTVIGTGSNQDSGDGGPAKNAGIYHPRGLAFDTYGNLYISTESGRIRKVDSSGNISTFAGLPAGSGGLVSEEAPADKIAFNKPLGMVYDSDNNFLYVADTGSHRVFRIDIANNVATNIAGNGQCAANADDNVPAVSTSLCSPTYVGLDSNKNVIVLDSGHNRIRRINFSYSVNGALAFAPTNKDLSTLSRNEDKTWVRKYRDGSTSYFDAEGNQTSHVTRLGLTTSFAHNSDGTLDSVTDSVGQVTRYNYSGGKLSSIQDPAGRSTYFKYSGLNLSEINFPDGSGRKFNYDDNGFLTAEMDITSTRKIQYGYNEYHRLSSVIDPLGHTTTLTDSQSLALGSELNSVGFNNSSIRTKITDSKNATVELINDLSGYVVKSKDAKGNVTTIERDFDGKPIKITKPNGSITELTYDAQTGDLLTSTETTLGITQTKTYDSYGNLLTLKDGKENTGTNTYNDKGLITSQVKVGGAQEEFSYNSLGLVTSQTLHPTSSQTLVFSREYDSKGNIIKATDASGRFITYSYDLAGNPLSETRQLASGTATILYEYDAFNRLTKVTNPNGDITTYQYYATGELASQTDAKGQITSYQYDASGNLISKVDPLGATRTFNYDELGNLVREVDPKGQIQTYSYDVMSKLVQVNRNDDVIQYGYNTEGELIEAKNSVSHIVFQRDVLGRVTLVNQSGSGTLSSYPSLSLAFGYDANGNRTSLSSSAVSLSYGYNSANRQTSVQSSLAGTYTFGYNNAGMLTAIQRPGGRTDISYFDNALTNSIIHSSGGSTNSFAQYNYDNRNLVIEKRAPASVVSYGYDGNGQLTSASSESFGYDPIGNRIVDNNGSYSYDSTGQRLEQDYAYTYSYDLNGNLTHKMPKDSSKEAYQFTYSSANQLVQVKVMDGALGQIKTQVDYAYDALGRRMQKSVWVSDAQTDPKKTYTRKYQYDGDNVLLEYNGANQVLAHYAYSQKSPDDILGAAITSAGVNAGLASSAGVYQYLKDALGSVSDVTDSSGNIVQRYQYSAFGKITAITDASGNDIASTPAINTSYLFTGREWDQEAGIYYYRARYYDANSGRFLQQDPHPGMTLSPLTTVNKYAYAVNSPSMFTDPSGKFAWFAIIAIGAIIGAAIGYIDYTRNGGDMWTKIGRGALGGALWGAAFAVNGAVAAFALVGSVAKASLTKGDFWENLNGNLIGDGAMALVGTIALWGINSYFMMPDSISGIFNNAIVNAGLAAASYPLLVNTTLGIYNTACDPEKGGLYRNDICILAK